MRQAPANVSAVLERLKEQGRAALFPGRTRVTVGAATCGMAAGAGAILGALEQHPHHRPDTAVLTRTGCIGSCHIEPLVLVQRPGSPAILLGPIVHKAVEQLPFWIEDDSFPPELVLGEINVRDCIERGLENGPSSNGFGSFFDRPFMKRQLRLATRNCGLVDPESIEEAIAAGGYQTLLSVLTQSEPEQVIDTVERSGLRGRGGGGFPTGRKWRTCRKTHSDIRFVVCNGDEGDPGAYMDRSLLESDPHQVIEGMIIGSYAIGAAQGFIYVRNEYPLAVARFDKALQACRTHGILGESILGTGHSFDITIVRGGGAFVCGESTALMASIEGKTGEPRAKYIHTVEQGLWDRPSTLNNVETWANVPAILALGAETYAEIGTPTSKGTKVFSLVGNVRRPGLIEIPMGMTLRDVIFDIGGGIPEDRGFKGVQTGGPSGGCLPSSFLDLEVDFERLTDAGSMMGSGAMIVMDETACMVDVARYFIDFLCEESCGKCVPCREGLGQLRRTLTAITEGRGKPEDLALLKEISTWLQDASLCQLGGSAPNPVLSTMENYREEYLAHIRDRKCPAGVCRALIRFDIDASLCNGCHLCAAACPHAAITGPAKQVHAMDQDKCSRCGACVEVCEPRAIRRVH